MIQSLRLALLTAHLHEVERERYEAGNEAFTWPAELENGRVGCPIVDFDLLEHVDRIYLSRLDRLKSLIAETPE